MEISKEERELIRKFEGIMSRGHYASSEQVTKLYNKVFNKQVSNTACGQCLRKRIQEMGKALNKLEAEEKKALEMAQESGFTTVEEAMAESNKIMEELKEMEVENVVSGKPSRTVKARKKTKPKAT